MAVRRIVKIDGEKCNGCGLCVDACHEGAIGLKNGKAVLLRDDYCDGLGDCLPACPEGAISFETREALAYDEAAVEANMAAKGALGSGFKGAGGEQAGFTPGVSERPREGVPDRKPGRPSSETGAGGEQAGFTPGVSERPREGVPDRKPGRPSSETGVVPDLPCGCPGSMSRTLAPMQAPAAAGPSAGAPAGVSGQSALRQWPVQIKLVPVNAPYFNGADLLIAADCTAYAHGNFHDEFIRGRVALIGCPKLDSADYSEKLTAILQQNDIRSITLTRMSVPCCGGLAQAVQRALLASGKNIPLRVVTISPEGAVS